MVWIENSQAEEIVIHKGKPKAYGRYDVHSSNRYLIKEGAYGHLSSWQRLCEY